MNALLEKECGAIPEGENGMFYFKQYRDYIGFEYEVAMYFSDEAFDPENYNEDSIQRESNIVIQYIPPFAEN